MVLTIGPSRKGKAKRLVKRLVKSKKTTVKRLVLVKGVLRTDKAQGSFRTLKLFCMIL